MPTIRQIASSKKRIAHLIFAAGFAGTIMLIELSGGHKGEMQFLLFIPFFIGFLAMFIAQFSIKCQACGGDLSPVVLRTGNPLAVSKKINFCPCCGISIDTEIPYCTGK